MDRIDRHSLAAQLYTLRECLGTPPEIAAALERVRAMGYPAVQISGMAPVDPVFVREALQRTGLVVCATHLPYEQLRDDPDGVVALHRLWDCSIVGIGAMPREFPRTEAGYLEFAREAAAIGRRLADRGLRLVYHNHRFEFAPIGGRTALEFLMDAADPDCLGLELDTYWVQAGGGCPASWIRQYAGRIDVIHLKDMTVVEDEAVMAEVGSGNLDWPAILGACRETGVRWLAVEQDVCRRDPFESLAMSLGFLGRFA